MFFKRRCGLPVRQTGGGNPWPMMGTIAAVFVLLSSCTFTQNGKERKVIQNGSVVELEYTVSEEQGEVIQSNKGQKPFTYTHGQGQIVPGLEKELSGMKPGDEKKIHLEPEEAYGPVNPQAFQEVPRKNLPAEGLKIGVTLAVKDNQGRTYHARVHEIKGESVVLDVNHPLAGKTLIFDVKVLDVK